MFARFRWLDANGRKKHLCLRYFVSNGSKITFASVSMELTEVKTHSLPLSLYKWK